MVTALSKLTVTGDPDRIVTHGFVTWGTGAVKVRCSWRVFPNAQLSRPGRAITTSIEIVSPGSTCVRGVSRPPRTETGIAFPSEP